MRRLLPLLATFIIAVALMGCVSENAPIESSNTRSARQAPDTGSNDEYYDVTINGTRCIVFKGYRLGGIDCDF